MASESARGEDELHRSARTQRRAHALDGLSALDRDVLLAIDQGGRDVAHVAHEVGRTEDEVRAILHRARARVATVLDQDDRGKS